MGTALGRIDEAQAALGPAVAAAVRRVFSELWGRDAATASIEIESLKRKGKVYRLRAAAGGTVRSLVVKRLGFRAAQRNRLTADRWLPRIGLAGVAPTLLGTVAADGGKSVWQVYEDVGGVTLHEQMSGRERVAAAAALIAELHTRAAGRPVVAECRREGEDFGLHYFTTNVTDALNLLQALRPPAVRPSAEQAAVRDRLRQRLERLFSDSTWRGRILADAGGPETMLHGDLWTTNVLVPGADGELRVRLIDWDHAGAGPISYDLSAFLYRFPRGERPWILDRYRDAAARAGWRLPPVLELNVLFDTAECARYANRVIWPAIALLHEGAEWGFASLAEVAQWFEALEPVLDE